MNVNKLLVSVAAGALTIALAQPAQALTININAGAGLSGNAAALQAFEDAADLWENIFTDNVTVEIDADMSSFGNTNVIGTTTNVLVQDGYNTVRNQMVLDAANEASNGIVAALPTAAQFSATIPSGFTTGTSIVGTKANLKALGFNAAALDAAAGTTNDATINFNSDFSFDYDNSDGVAAGTKDFLTVAAHELGHALGFLSIVDIIDGIINSGGNPGVAPPTTLDLFRFNDATLLPNAGAFTTAARELRPGEASDFNDLTNEFAMSTGKFGGDGNQASHWKADEISGIYIGIFDPTLANATINPITAADIRALDLIGWDVGTQIPEPASLALFAFGLGGLGIALRRRKTA